MIAKDINKIFDINTFIEKNCHLYKYFILEFPFSTKNASMIFVGLLDKKNNFTTKYFNKLRWIPKRTYTFNKHKVHKTVSSK